MTSKSLLNNAVLRQKRELSQDSAFESRFGLRQQLTKLPSLQKNDTIARNVAADLKQKKRLVSRKCGSNESSSERQIKSHSRKGSNGQSDCSTRPSSSTSLQFLFSPKEKLQMNLISDYGKEIDGYLKELMVKSQLSQDHLATHKINGVYRAKMIDWMVEVMTAFKCEDQTFFLAVNIMDRFFDQSSKNNQVLELQDLHITGVACMFIASKYQDIFPLLLKTVFNKIGHQKISVETIREKEMEILRTLGFMIGGAPTPFEFMQSYMEQALVNHKEKEFVHLMATYLGKMSLHHDKLCTKQANLLGASSVYVALKICEQMRQQSFITKSLLQNIIDVSGVEERKLIECSKKLLYLAQNFEKELPGLSNLKTVYIPLLNSFVSQQQ